MSAHHNYLIRSKSFISKEEIKKRQEQETIRENIRTFNEYGNLLIGRNEIDYYKQILPNFVVRECVPKSRRCVIIERTRKKCKLK